MSLQRISVTVFLMLIVFIFVEVETQGQTLQPERFNAAQFEDYEKKLNAILKTRRDEEKAFVKAVVEKVKTGKLPSKLIQTSFQWVRNKRPNTKYPFIYFERVLRIQATKVGFRAEVPAFDYGIYSQRLSSSRSRSTTR